MLLFMMLTQKLFTESKEVKLTGDKVSLNFEKDITGYKKMVS